MELDALMRKQNVAQLPEIYRELMMSGLIEVFSANVTPAGLMQWEVKKTLLETLDREGISYPPDLFVFYEHNGDEILFFRTDGDENDPPVYAYRGEGYFTKSADSLSALALSAADSLSRLLVRKNNIPQIKQGAFRPNNGPLKIYYYDTLRNMFYEDVLSTYDGPLGTEKLLEMLRFEYGESEGCTAAEIEALRVAQEVGCLPDVYRQVMMLMGKNGIDVVLGGAGLATCDHLLTAKSAFVSKMRQLRIRKEYPSDIFVFFTYQGIGFYFFRTKGCVADPAVYSYENGFYRLADSFSAFLHQLLDPSISRQTAKRARWHQVELEYAVDKDSFLPRATLA